MKAVTPLTRHDKSSMGASSVTDNEWIFAVDIKGLHERGGRGGR